MKKYSLLLAFFALFFIPFHLAAQSFDSKAVEKISRAVVEKAYASSVRIWGFDTVKREQNSAQFSGVVVSAEGHILTAAHATVPGNTYQVFFTDGKEYLAVALGRIGFKDKQNLPDVAILKLLGKGKWPYAEMGWSSSLKTNELCWSIAYPETLDQKLPALRFGQITNPMTEWGFVQSSCKMEPGDSGGPLFDAMGRVIALHSRIDLPEEINFEVPVDLYRKYWTALQKVEDYGVLPVQLDSVHNDPLADRINVWPGIENLADVFLKAGKKFAPAAVRIKSRLRGKTQVAAGTLLLLNHKAGKGGSYVLAKSSLIGEAGELLLEDNGLRKLKLLARDIANDLVLLQPEGPVLKGGINLAAADTLAPVFSDLGKFLISPVAEGTSCKAGILGSLNFKLPRKFSIGFFGAGANFQNGQIILTRMAPDGPAAMAKLELGDQITGINGVPISRPEQYGGELMKYSPGDSISIQGVRKGISYNLMVGVGVVPLMNGHPAGKFKGGKSIRLDGFDQVFVQDAALLPEECGGPVFDTNGRFYGVNIARFSRTSTLVMPAQVIFRFIERSLYFL